MKFWLAGEGPSDLGFMAPRMDGAAFVPGPMAELLDQLLEPLLYFSPLALHAGGADCIRYVDKAELRQKFSGGPTLLPGLKRGQGTAYYTRNAQVLGSMARLEAEETGEPTLAVLFRDGDGTRSMGTRQWQEKFDSMVNGFALVGYACGVPMVPRPKSEAWLLCAFMPRPYLHCEALEAASGNDDSPQSLKIQMDRVLGHKPSAAEQAGWVRDGTVDAMRIALPSFLAFRKELCRALTAAGIAGDLVAGIVGKHLG